MPRHTRRPTTPPGLHPVMDLPEHLEVLDLTAGPMQPAGPWWWGRYDEDRRGVYTQALFSGARTVHVGVDLGAPAATPVRWFADGVVEHAGFNPAPGDYGHVVVTRHDLPEGPLWCLWGHLSAETLARSPVGARRRAGEVLGWLGAEDENGGWPPHLHLQLAVDRPATHDLPGAVSASARAEALRAFPDPARILGALAR